MTAGQFQDWQTITDFGLLKSWTVGCIRDSTLLHSILDIHPFQQLTRLTLVLRPRDDEDLEFWRAAGSMFKSLPPLTYLRLFGTYTPAFLNGQVLSQHGSTLLTLELDSTKFDRKTMYMHRPIGQIGPIFSNEDVVELAGQCLSLQKLSICFQRYQGLETGTWTAFGRFPCLRELDVILSCIPEMNADMMPVPPRELSEFEKSLIVHPSRNISCPKWFIRDCIINFVINESLAKEYFTHIGACQDAECLTQLVIYPSIDQYHSQTSGGRYFIGDHFFSEMALIWTVERKFPTGLLATSRKRSINTRIRNEFAEEASSSILLSM
ncbi:hypothetical protein N7520_003508 [Penicillium odoratum]|uniref:uncharacterized protein n=1 Tax=Penicillium odoratum TaxID=1167516 RepID=UPI002548D152|nr:uncharacterized protein N7520_003508 [Penicillium odoratum]KAJ5768949.1 hypothetical protein N7520_003508 [Penicillium odoratum]